MKKYAIVIGEENEKVSFKVQEALFKAGFSWCGGGINPSHLDAVVLNLNCNDDGIISYDHAGSVSLAATKMQWLLPSYVIANADKLEGAKKVVKKMTVAEIAEQLGYDVEVVKG